MKKTDVTNEFRDGLSREFDKDGKLVKIDGKPVDEDGNPIPDPGPLDPETKGGN